MSARAAVYNRFWHSAGGGERHAGMIAQVLSHEVPVELLGHTEVDLNDLGDHLGLDLSRCSYRRLPDRGDDALADASAAYDLWVTASYMSRLQPRSRRAAYLCFFPTPFDHDLTRAHKLAVRVLGPTLRGVPGGLGAGEGWFPPEGGRRRRWIWSSGDGVVSLPHTGARGLRADFGRPGAPGPTQLTITDGEKFSVSLPVTPTFTHHRIPLPQDSRGLELRFQSDTFRPGGTDVRELGVAVSRMRLDGSRMGPRRYAAIRFPWLRMDPKDLRFLDGYDTILANSEYTRGWISRLWDRDSDVLFPPIAVDTVHPSAEREQVILSVGRFFAPGLGHAKRQLEMVRWFGDLHRSGRLPGWRLHVVGGCERSQEPYLAKIRAAAKGLPVDITANAPRSLVQQLLSSSAIFWSATGWGEDNEARPWAAEHFGMTTVEAMAGGCVPVVIDLAGQREIVKDGVVGFRWSTPEQLLDLTVRVARDPELRDRLSIAAVADAQQFSEQAFARRWSDIAARRLLLQP
jgi:glycosyltransferase involved in cell wall biosynthesis